MLPAGRESAAATREASSPGASAFVRTTSNRGLAFGFAGAVALSATAAVVEGAAEEVL